MTQPISFTSQTPRFSLPLLFAGQAQKEFFFNEAQLIIDALLHLTVEGMSISPPETSTAGDCWIVGANPQDAWSGQADSIAIFLTGSWKFVSPRTGMTAFDRSTGQRLYYDTSWDTPTEPSNPQGGSTVDAEARGAISSLIEAIRQAGVFVRA